MKKIFLISGLALLLSSGSITAQHKWSLRECIEYALENNIEIKQQEINVEESQLDVRDYRNAMLPNLSAGASQNFSFGRAPSPNDNTYINSQSSSTSVSASSSVPVYQGGAIRNRIKLGKLNLQAAVASLESARENLELQIATYYLEVLYRKELLRVYEQELRLSEKQLERAETLVETGMSPRTELLESRSQVAANQVRYTTAAGNLETAILNLTQALNLESMYGFDVVEPDTEKYPLDRYLISSPDEIFAQAVEVKPHIREQQLRLESSLANVKIARAALFPTVSFGLSYSNGYSYIFSNDFNESFAKQIRTRGNEGIGINISIPIYNRGMTRSNISRAHLAVRTRELYLENTKLNIYKEIQQAYLSAQNAVEEHRATEAATEASAEAYRLTEEGFNLGSSTALQLEESRSKLIASLSERVRSKYEYIFRIKILDFYRGVPITL